MNSRRRRSLLWSESPSCWNCARLKRSKRVIHEDSLSDPHGCFSMSAPSFMDALAAFHCDNYWFGQAPDAKEMLCGGKDHKFKNRH